MMKNNDENDKLFYTYLTYTTEFRIERLHTFTSWKLMPTKL